MHTTQAAHLNLRSYLSMPTSLLGLSRETPGPAGVGRGGTGQDALQEASVAPAGGPQGLHLRLHRVSTSLAGQSPSGSQLPDLGPPEATEGDVGSAGWPVSTPVALALRGDQWRGVLRPEPGRHVDGRHPPFLQQSSPDKRRCPPGEVPPSRLPR